MAVIRDVEDDYTREAAEARLRTVSEAAGSLEHIGSYCFDPGEARGNIENFAGATQVPLGFACLLLVKGEHARDEFFVPLATSEGTLVASYNRGMKVAREAGGVRTTVLDDAIQRAPAFGFDSAYEARAFGDWIREHFDEIKKEAESSTRTGSLRTSSSTRRARSLQLRKRRCSRTEHVWARDGCGVRVDCQDLRRDPPLPIGGELSDR